MALRKLRKMLKPVIWVIVVAFIASIFALGIGTGMGNRQQVAIKVNGQNIEVAKVENRFNQRVMEFRSYYQETADPDFIRLTAMQDLIDEKLLEIEAKNRKIRVSRAEEKSAFEQATANIPSQDELVRRLRYQGMNIADLKRIIKEGLIAEKTKQAIINEYTPSTNDMKEYYEENKEMFGDDSFESVKDEIIETFINRNGVVYYNGWIEKRRREADIEVVSPRYNNFLEKPVLRLNDHTVFNTEFYEKIFIQRIYGGTEDSSMYDLAINQYKERVALADEARRLGLESESYFTSEDRLHELRNLLEDNIRENYEYTDEDLYEYFSENESRYEKPATAKVKVIPFKYTATEEDKKSAKEKAETVLKLLEDEGQDFSELAREFSEGPTAVEGGYLGWFYRGSMVPEFEEAVFSGEIGVYPSIVQTIYGYHIIKILDRDDSEGRAEARHILINTNPSEKTIANANTKAEELFSEIETIEDFEEILASESTTPKEIGPIEHNGRVGEIGSDRELSDFIFNELEIGEIELVKTDIGSYIITKTDYSSFEPADFDTSKATIKNDFLDKKVRDRINELRETLKEKVKVEILDSKIKETLIQQEETEEL